MNEQHPARRQRHGQRPTEPLTGWPEDFGADSSRAAEAAQPASTERPTVIKMSDQVTLRYEARTTGEPGWLLYIDDRLVRAMGLAEVDLIEASLAAGAARQGGNTNTESARPAATSGEAHADAYSQYVASCRDRGVLPCSRESFEADSLQQLKALALAAEKDGQHIYIYPRDSNKWAENDAWHKAARPEVFLDLIARIESTAAPAPVAERCIACDGTGYSTGSVLMGGRCTHCNGTGKAPATASGDDLPKSFADYDKAIDSLTALLRKAWAERDEARAAVSAATKPTADLSKLTRYGFIVDECGEVLGKSESGEFVKLADVQSLLATKPAPLDLTGVPQYAIDRHGNGDVHHYVRVSDLATKPAPLDLTGVPQYAIDRHGNGDVHHYVRVSDLATKPAAQAVPEGWREKLYTAAINCGHSIDENKIVLHRDKRKEGNALSQLADRLAAAIPAAPLSADAAQEQARNDALEDAAKEADDAICSCCWSEGALSAAEEIADRIRALKRPAAGAEGAA